MVHEVAIEDGDLIDGLAVVTDPLESNPEALETLLNTIPTLGVAGLPAPEDTVADALASLPSSLVAPRPINVPAGDEPLGLSVEGPSALNPMLEGLAEDATVD